MICETMSLYTGNLTEIGWNNVEAFCDEGIQENRTLDYKEEFPSHLENTIAAMANTFGGVVLIGVAEDDDSRPAGHPRHQLGRSDRSQNCGLGRHQ